MPKAILFTQAFNFSPNKCLTNSHFCENQFGFVTKHKGDLKYLFGSFCTILLSALISTGFNKQNVLLPHQRVKPCLKGVDKGCLPCVSCLQGSDVFDLGANGFLGISDSVTVRLVSAHAGRSGAISLFPDVSDPGSEGEEAFRASRANPA